MWDGTFFLFCLRYHKVVVQTQQLQLTRFANSLRVVHSRICLILSQCYSKVASCRTETPRASSTSHGPSTRGILVKIIKQQSAIFPGLTKSQPQPRSIGPKHPATWATTINQSGITLPASSIPPSASLWSLAKILFEKSWQRGTNNYIYTAL